MTTTTISTMAMTMRMKWIWNRLKIIVKPKYVFNKLWLFESANYFSHWLSVDMLWLLWFECCFDAIVWLKLFDMIIIDNYFDGGLNHFFNGTREQMRPNRPNSRFNWNEFNFRFESVMLFDMQILRWNSYCLAWWEGRRGMAEWAVEVVLPSETWRIEMSSVSFEGLKKWQNRTVNWTGHFGTISEILVSQNQLHRIAQHRTMGHWATNQTDDQLSRKK